MCVALANKTHKLPLFAAAEAVVIESMDEVERVASSAERN
jgi:hypothetical protein